MNKEILIELINIGDSQRKMAIKLSVSESTIRYWLNYYRLKTNNTRYNNKDKEKHIKEKKCPKCNMNLKISEFYVRSDRKTTTGYCKKCNINYNRERLIEIKTKMINYKGGKCSQCGLSLKNSHYSVFDFHHINPKEKDINFSKIKFKKWETIKNEIDKCQLICANCHRIIHSSQ